MQANRERIGNQVHAAALGIGIVAVVEHSTFPRNPKVNLSIFVRVMKCVETLEMMQDGKYVFLFDI
jgi:hypothetical protein